MSERKMIIDGNGVTVSQGSAGIGNLVSIDSLPGWEKPEIDDTALDNQGVTTFVLGKLKTYSDLAITIKLSGASAIAEGNSRWTINFPGGGGSLVFWGDVKKQGEPSFQNGQGVTVPGTIKPTNLNSSGSVTPPVWSGGAAVSPEAVVTSGAQVG